MPEGEPFMAWLLFLFLVILVIIKDKEQEKNPAYERR